VDQIIRRDAYEILVESSVVNRAKAEAVSDDGLAVFFEIAHNMRRVKEAELL
jgi:hypothetical protein